jgi:hypothetical protein
MADYHSYLSINATETTQEAVSVVFKPKHPLNSNFRLLFQKGSVLPS